MPAAPKMARIPEASIPEVNPYWEEEQNETSSSLPAPINEMTSTTPISESTTEVKQSKYGSLIAFLLATTVMLVACGFLWAAIGEKSAQGIGAISLVLLTGSLGLWFSVYYQRG